MSATKSDVPLPTRFPDSTSRLRALQHFRFIQRFKPVIIQPLIDCQRGNQFFALFYHFHTDNPKAVTLSLLYESEASYQRTKPSQLNRFASFLYRSHNYRCFHRTIDINHLQYDNCNVVELEKNDELSLLTSDYSGSQTWSQGDKHRNLLHFYSLVYHYNLQWTVKTAIPQQAKLQANGTNASKDEIRIDVLSLRVGDNSAVKQISPSIEASCHQSATVVESLNKAVEQSTSALASSSVAQSSHQSQLVDVTSPGSQPPCFSCFTVPFCSKYQRPLLYINTSNHLCSPLDNNPQLAKHHHVDYPVFIGDRSVAEAFARHCHDSGSVKIKYTLYNMLPKCLLGQRPIDKEISPEYSSVDFRHLFKPVTDETFKDAEQ